MTIAAITMVPTINLYQPKATVVAGNLTQVYCQLLHAIVIIFWPCLPLQLSSVTASVIIFWSQWQTRLSLELSSCSSIKRENPLDFGYDRQIVIDQHHIIVALLKSSPGMCFREGSRRFAIIVKMLLVLLLWWWSKNHHHHHHIYVEMQPWYVFLRVEGRVCN